MKILTLLIENQTKWYTDKTEKLNSVIGEMQPFIKPKVRFHALDLFTQRIIEAAKSAAKAMTELGSYFRNLRNHDTSNKL